MSRLRVIEVAGFRLPFGAGNARMRWASREGALVRVIDDEGREGFGEASPLPGYSRDSLRRCGSALRRWASTACGQRVGGAAELSERLGAWHIRSASARFAVESAMLDLIGRTAGTPAWRLLRRTAAPSPSPVALSSLVEGADVLDRLASARRARAAGIGTVKMKIGAPRRFGREMMALRAVVAAGRLSIRLDANRAWSLEQARSRLRRIARYRPQFVEEPCAVEHWQELADCGVAIAADETLQRRDGVQSALRLADRGVCRVFVLKPSVLGGADRCLALARRAARAGADVVVTHAFDGPVARAAAADLALALDPPPLACGVGDVPSSTPVCGGVSRIRGDRIIPGAAPGLGVAPSAFEHYEAAPDPLA
jgi:o-succinylbenzoate synthase